MELFFTAIVFVAAGALFTGACLKFQRRPVIENVLQLAGLLVWILVSTVVMVFHQSLFEKVAEGERFVQLSPRTGFYICELFRQFGVCLFCAGFFIDALRVWKNKTSATQE